MTAGQGFAAVVLLACVAALSSALARLAQPAPRALSVPAEPPDPHALAAGIRARLARHGIATYTDEYITLRAERRLREPLIDHFVVRVEGDTADLVFTDLNLLERSLATVIEGSRMDGAA